MCALSEITFNTIQRVLFFGFIINLLQIQTTFIRRFLHMHCPLVDPLGTSCLLCMASPSGVIGPFWPISNSDFWTLHIVTSSSQFFHAGHRRRSWGSSGAAQSAVLCVNAYNERSLMSSFIILANVKVGLMNVVVNAFILAFVKVALSQPNFVQEFVRLPQKTQLKHSENRRCSGGGDSQSGNTSHHSRTVA